jgi:hypothetical protein
MYCSNALFSCLLALMSAVDLTTVLAVCYAVSCTLSGSNSPHAVDFALGRKDMLNGATYELLLCRTTAERMQCRRRLWSAGACVHTPEPYLPGSLFCRLAFCCQQVNMCACCQRCVLALAGQQHTRHFPPTLRLQQQAGRWLYGRATLVAHTCCAQAAQVVAKGQSCSCLLWLLPHM